MIAEQIMRVIANLERVCPACLAATSRETWTLLHALRWMRSAVADYERRVRAELRSDADDYFAASRSGGARRPLCTLADRRTHYPVWTMADHRAAVG